MRYWMRFTIILASRIINNAILPLDSEDRANVLIIDDSMFERNRSKKVELLAKVYDHAKHKYRFGFRMLTLGWSDGSTFLPVNSVLLSTENRKNRINEATEVDKRTVGYRRRKLSMEKGTQAMLTLLDAAMKDMETITGQKAVPTRAKNSIANFKLRAGMPIGCKVTLRGDKMYEFLDRLVNLALPRVRDFRGVNPNAFDGRGNYALGIKEQLIFPEIEYDQVDKVRGMDVIFVTTAHTDEEARELLTLFGMPYAK